MKVGSSLKIVTSIKLFASYDKEDDGTITFGDRTMIPKSWIVKITEI